MKTEAELVVSGANHPRKCFAGINGNHWMDNGTFASMKIRDFTHPMTLLNGRIKSSSRLRQQKTSCINDMNFHDCCWYQPSFNIDQSKKKTILLFCTVDYQAKVWINGKYIGCHEDGSFN